MVLVILNIFLFQSPKSIDQIIQEISIKDCFLISLLLIPIIKAIADYIFKIVSFVWNIHRRYIYVFISFIVCSLLQVLAWRFLLIVIFLSNALCWVLWLLLLFTSCVHFKYFFIYAWMSALRDCFRFTSI